MKKIRLSYNSYWSFKKIADYLHIDLNQAKELKHLINSNMNPDGCNQITEFKNIFTILYNFRLQYPLK